MFSSPGKSPSLLSRLLLPPAAQNCQNHFLMKCSSDPITLPLTPIRVLSAFRVKFKLLYLSPRNSVLW